MVINKLDKEYYDEWLTSKRFCILHSNSSSIFMQKTTMFYIDRFCDEPNAIIYCIRNK